jgi:hypothetical protein
MLSLYLFFYLAGRQETSKLLDSAGCLYFDIGFEILLELQEEVQVSVIDCLLI